MDERRVKGVIGTLAHNRAFEMREIDQYTRFDPVPLIGRHVVKDLIRRELLSQIDNPVGRNTFYPTRKGWNWIENEL